MKKIIKLFSLFILIIGLFINIGVVNAKDVTSGFSVNDIKVCADEDCSEEYTTTNPTNHREFAVKFNWEYDGETIEDGDQIRIPFANEVETTTQVYWNGIETSNAPLYNQNNIKIGTFTIEGFKSRKKLIITFNSNAVGKNSLKGTIQTSLNGNYLQSTREAIVPLTVYDKKVEFMISPTSIHNLKYKGNYCYTAGGSNTRIENHITTEPVFNLIEEVFKYEDYTSVTDDVKINNLVYELVASGKDYIVDFVKTAFPSTKTLTPHLNNGTELSDLIGYEFQIIEQGDLTLSEFRNRIHNTKYSYGIYKDHDTGKTFYLLNFGDFPNNIKYSDVYNESISDIMMRGHPFVNTRDVSDLTQSILSQNNIVNGTVLLFRAYSSIIHEQVYVNTNFSYIGSWSYTDGDGKIHNYSGECNYTLKTPKSIVVAEGEVVMILRDKTSLQPIEGINYQLQKKSGSNWTNIGDLQTTDVGGKVSIKNLDDGEYRWVQQNYKDHYINNSYKLYSDENNNNEINSFTLDGKVKYATNERESVTIMFKPGTNGEFRETTLNLKYGDAIVQPEFETTTSTGWVFTGWDKEVNPIATENKTYTAKWEKYVNIIEHFYIEGTTTKVKNDKTTKNVKVGSSYNITRDDSGIASKYVYVSTTGTTSGVVPDGNVEIKYYYKLKPATVTTKHLEETTNFKLADDVIQNKKYDDVYTTTKASSIGANYDMVRTTGDPVSGTITKDSYVITYYYKKKNSKITNNISKTSTNTDITNKEDIVNYTIANNINITDYIGNGTVVITDTLPYEIDVDKSNINGALYNKDNKTLTWTETWNGIDSFNNKGNKTITKNISLVFKNIDSKQRVITNNISSKVLLDNNESINTDNISIPLQIKGKVIIKYLDEDDNELTDTIEEENLVGETISSEVLEFVGFDLIEKPESEVHEVKDEITEIIYKYKKKVLNIEVESGSGGKVTGGGSVKYGEDSNDIVINADEGYCIDKIIVDDKEISVVNCKNQTLDKFTNVKENHKIKVTFKKNIVNSNPVTSSLLKIATLIILIGISSILIINNKKLIKNN